MLGKLMKHLKWELIRFTYALFKSEVWYELSKIHRFYLYIENCIYILSTMWWVDIHTCSLMLISGSAYLFRNLLFAGADDTAVRPCNVCLCIPGLIYLNILQFYPICHMEIQEFLRHINFILLDICTVIGIFGHIYCSVIIF